MSEKLSKQSYNIVGLLLLLFAATLLVFFLQSRGDDLGKLPEFLREFASGSFISFAGFLASLSGLVIAILIWFSWFGVGNWFEKFLIKREPETFDVLSFARNSAIGAAIFSLLWFFLGAIGAYKSAVAIAVLVLGIVAGLTIFKTTLGNLKLEKRAHKSDALEKTSVVLLCLLFLFGLIAALAPPTAKDTLLYHLAVPKAFIAQGNFSQIEGNIASFLALGTEMQSVWAMLVGNVFSARIGEVAATATIFGFAPLMILAVYGWARELEIEKSWAFLASLLVASVPTVFHDATNSYVDCALALYFTLAIYSVTKFWSSHENRWLIYLAISTGAALSIKLTTLFLVVAILLLLLLRARAAAKEAESTQNSPSIFLKGAGALAVGGLIASPWYLKTWIKTGSPLFPFYMNLWKGEATGWDVERSTLFQLMNSRYGGAEKTVFDYLFAPFKISLVAQPEIAKYFDGVLGVAFLVGLPLLVLAYWKKVLPAEVKIALGVCAIFFLFWLFSSQQLRYLLPILPSLAVSIVLAETALKQDKISRKFAYFAFLACALAASLVSFSWFLEKNPVRVVLGGESRDEYLARRLDYYKYYQLVNADNSPEMKVWLINMRRDSYYIDKPFFSDYIFEDWTLKKMVDESKTVDELREKVRAMGITHILARHDVLLDFKQSAILDDKKSETFNRAKLKLAQDLILDKEKTIRSDAHFSLVKLN